MKRARLWLKEHSWLLMALVIAAPFGLSILYAMPCKDDFLMAGRIWGTENMLADALKATNSFYMGWNGMWPYLFLEYVLNPLMYAPAYSHLAGVELLLFFAAFVATFYFYVKELLWFFFGIGYAEDRESGSNGGLRGVHLVYLLALFAFLNVDYYQQIFYWFVANVAYLFSVVFLMISQIFMMRYFGGDDGSGKRAFSGKRQIARAVGMTLLGFLACFCYQLGIFQGIVYLMCLRKWKDSTDDERAQGNLKNGKTALVQIAMRLVPLGVMVVGGLISLLAPGNFARYDTVEGHLGVLGLLGLTLGNTVSYLGNAVTSPVFWWMAVGCVYVGYKWGKRREIYGDADKGDGTEVIEGHVDSARETEDDSCVSWNAVSVYVLCMLASLFGIIFPLALGYPTGIILTRMLFMINFVIVAWAVIIFTSIGRLYKAHVMIADTLTSENPMLTDRPVPGFRAAVLALLTITTLVIFNLPTQATSINISLIGQPTSKYYQSLPWFYTATNLKTCATENKYYTDIFRNIYSSPDKDVTITAPDTNTPSGVLVIPLNLIPGTEDELEKYTCTVLEKDSIKITN